MKQLDEFKRLRQEIFDYFGYVEDWVVIPIEDRRKYYWQVNQDENGFGHVLFCDCQLTNDIVEKGTHYQDEIYTQRFLPKWVYRGEEYTMICVDTRTDDNKFLAIFDNSKEQTDITSEFCYA